MLLGKKIIELDTVDSTNLFAQRLLKSEPPSDGTVIFARHQTCGLGYGNTNWLSELGKNLLVSIILYPRFLDSHKIFFLNQSVANGIHGFVKKILKTGDNVRIKWPNDIFYKDSKIAGTLINNSFEGEILRDTIIGIGININQTDFPKDLPNPTSLKLITKRDYSLIECLNILLESLEKNYLLLMAGNYSQILKDYLQLQYKYYTWSEFCDLNNNKFEGRIINISDEGKICIETKNKIKYFDFKEIDYII